MLAEDITRNLDAATRSCSQLGEKLGSLSRHVNKIPGLPALLMKHRFNLGGVLEEMAGSTVSIKRQLDYVGSNMQQLDRERREMSLIYDMALDISSSLSHEDVLQRTLDKAIEIMSAERGFVLLVSKETGNLEFSIGRDLNEKVFDSTEFSISRSIAQDVIQSGEAILTSDAAHESTFKSRASIVNLQILSILCVPLKVKGEVTGVVYLDSRSTKKLFTKQSLEMLKVFASQAAIAIENARLVRHIHEMYFKTIVSLGTALEAKDTYTQGHSERVTDISVEIARKIGLEHDHVELIRTASLLHDIGKIGIDEKVLNKPGRLTNTEFSHIKEHPVIGDKILTELFFLNDERRILRHHHERWDGKGYPDGLKGDDIPLESRILTVADCFDAMTSRRPYRDPLPMEVAVEEIRKGSGTQFDPDIAGAFLTLVDEGVIAEIMYDDTSHQEGIAETG